MSNSILLALTAHNASSAAIDVHALQEFLLAIHALKLDVDIAGHGRICLFVMITLFENLFGFDLQFLDLLLGLVNFGVNVFALLLETVVLFDGLVKLLLFDEQFAHLLHVFEVAHVGKTQVDGPDVILVLVDLIKLAWNHLIWLLGANIFNPCVVDTFQLVQRLGMRWLRDHNCEVLGYTGACVDFQLDLVLNLLKAKHHAPEQERYNEVEEDDHEADHILGDLDVRAANRDTGSAALGDHNELPVAWTCSHQIALTFRQLALIEVELACLLALTLGLEDSLKRSLIGIIELKVVT